MLLNIVCSQLCVKYKRGSSSDLNMVLFASNCFVLLFPAFRAFYVLQSCKQSHSLQNRVRFIFLLQLYCLQILLAKALRLLPGLLINLILDTNISLQALHPYHTQILNASFMQPTAMNEFALHMERAEFCQVCE